MVKTSTRAALRRYARYTLSPGCGAELASFGKQDHCYWLVGLISLAVLDTIYLPTYFPQEKCHRRVPRIWEVFQFYSENFQAAGT